MHEEIRKALDSLNIELATATRPIHHNTAHCKFGAKLTAYDIASLLADRDRLEAEVERIKRAGGMLSNIAFNLSQQCGKQLTPEVCAAMDQFRKAWDAAIAGEKQG